MAPVSGHARGPSTTQIGYLAVYGFGFIREVFTFRPLGCAGVAVGRIVQAVDGPPSAPGEEVVIDRQGESRGMVPELLLDVLERLPGFDQEAREGVTQGVGLR
jgi:hypothetical protein